MKSYQKLVVVASLLVMGGCIPELASQGPSPAVQEASQIQPNISLPSDQGTSEVVRTVFAQLIELQKEVKDISSKLEEVEFDIQNSKRRQINLLDDMDRRVLRIERAQRLLSFPQGSPTQGGENINALTTDPASVTYDAGTNNTSGIAEDSVVPVAGLIPAPVDEILLTTSEQPAVTTGSTTEPASPQPTTKVVSTEEQDAYDQAFKLLKQSKYEDAIKQFEYLTMTWPDGLLADDAYYWISEAYYVNRETESALKSFKVVTSRYPNSERVPEALLKIGYIFYDIGAYSDAAAVFSDILVRFPGHQVSGAAQTRLRRIQQTIQ